jgi:hypothetical protein
MSINIIRTADGWFVDRGGTAVPIDTSAATTRELLSDRQNIDAAATAALDRGPLAQPASGDGPAQCRAVAQPTSITFTELLPEVHRYADAQLPVLVDLRVDAAADIGCRRSQH